MTDSITWTGTNDAEVVDFLDRWHMGESWYGNGCIILGTKMVQLNPGDAIVRHRPHQWEVVTRRPFWSEQITVTLVKKAL